VVNQHTTLLSVVRDSKVELLERKVFCLQGMHEGKEGQNVLSGEDKGGGKLAKKRRSYHPCHLYGGPHCSQ